MSKFISGILDFIKEILNSFFETINRILNYIFYVLTTYPVELIIGIIIVYLFILLVHDIIVRIRVKRFSEDTEIALRQKLGYIILIFGKIRVGKTTLMSALTHVIVRILRYNAMSRCEQVRGIILNLDWGRNRFNNR